MRLRELIQNTKIFSRTMSTVSGFSIFVVFILRSGLLLLLLHFLFCFIFTQISRWKKKRIILKLKQ